MVWAAVDVHIFCDESGGTDAANDVFLVAATAIEPHDAQRLAKTFGKAIKLKGEVKGHDLTYSQRSIFFDILSKHVEVFSTTVVCSRADATGAWAIGALEETCIYGGLVEEACLALSPPRNGSLTVTPDGGRYPKLKAEMIRKTLVEQLEVVSPDCRVNVSYGNSATVHGVQIADIIANSVYQALSQSGSSHQIKELMQPLIDLGRLNIQAIELGRLRPLWVAAL